MNSRQFVPTPNKGRSLRIIAAIVLVVLIFVVPVTRNGVRTGVNAVGTTILRGTNSVGGWFGSVVTDFRSKHALEAENASLKAHIDQLNTELVKTNTLEQENADIKQALNRTEKIQFTLAAVLAKPPHSIYDTLIIDGGSSAGISVGQTVYANSETPIGFVDQVLSKSAVVKLYSAPGEKYDARLSPAKIDVTLVGRGGGNFEASIPHDVVVADGAVVVTKELNPAVVAVFKKITSDARDPFQTLLLAAPVNIDELSFVQVRQ